MSKKRFIVELGTGADLHGEDVTKAACRAVRDAISHGCLCGLVEILERDSFEGVYVDVVLASPRPEDIDLEQVKQVIPIGIKTARAEAGGMQTSGLCVNRFAPNCSDIVIVNAAVTVSVK